MGLSGERVAPARAPVRRQPQPRARRLTRALVALAALLAASGGAAADEARPHWTATRTTSAPIIDGALDDAAWARAPAERRFTQNFPDEGHAPSQATELRVLYDDEALYIGVRCFDRQPDGIVARLSRRDRDTDADRVQIDISSQNDGATAFLFDINAAGVLVDGIRFNDTDYVGDWDGVWRGAARRDRLGWSAELAIPLGTLRYQPGRGAFGFQVRRQIERRQEIDEWSYIPRAVGREVSYYGTLDGFSGLHAHRLFELMPYLAVRLTARAHQPPLDGVALGGDIGGDLKLGITPALTLDATINPDFGQVEADQVVLNLTTYETFLPEKRPFFLERLDLFATPIELFYSRRIGRAPEPPRQGTLSEPLPDGRIWAAAKLTGLVAPHTRIAALEALTAADDAVVTRDGQKMSQLVSPLSSYGALRLSRDFAARSSVAAMATAVTSFEPAGLAAPRPGDLCVDGTSPSARGRCTHDAYAGAVDTFLRTRDGGWTAQAQVAGSAIVDGPTRVAPDGTAIGPGAASVGVFFDGARQNGVLIGDLFYQAYSPAFDVNDLGYLRQANLQQWKPTLRLRILRPFGPILDGQLRAGASLRASWDLRTWLQHELWLAADLRFVNFWQLYLEVDYDTDHIDLRETHDGARTERVGGWSFAFAAKSDPRRRFVVQANGDFYRVRRGLAMQALATISLRVPKALELDLIPHATWTFGDPRWYDTVDDGDGERTYYFADLDSRSVDVTLRATYAFSPTLTLQCYAQLFLAAGHWSNSAAARTRGAQPSLPLSAFVPVAPPPGLPTDVRSGALNVNVVLRWEYRPGATLLAVYTRAQAEGDYDPSEGAGRLRLDRLAAGPATDTWLIKAGFLLD